MSDVKICECNFNVGIWRNRVDVSLDGLVVMELKGSRAVEYHNRMLLWVAGAVDKVEFDNDRWKVTCESNGNTSNITVVPYNLQDDSKIVNRGTVDSSFSYNVLDHLYMLARYNSGRKLSVGSLYNRFADELTLVIDGNEITIRGKDMDCLQALVELRLYMRNSMKVGPLVMTRHADDDDKWIIQADDIEIKTNAHTAHAVMMELDSHALAMFESNISLPVKPLDVLLRFRPFFVVVCIATWHCHHHQTIVIGYMWRIQSGWIWRRRPRSTCAMNYRRCAIKASVVRAPHSRPRPSRSIRNASTPALRVGCRPSSCTIIVRISPAQACMAAT